MINTQNSTSLLGEHFSFVNVQYLMTTDLRIERCVLSKQLTDGCELWCKIVRQPMMMKVATSTTK